MHGYGTMCFCYVPDGAIYLKNIWSTIQVNISSTEMLEVVSVPEEHNCQRSENLFAFFKCLVNNIWKPGISKEVIMSLDQYGDKTCFKVQPLQKVSYTVSAQQNMLDHRLFLLFVVGGLLFHFAHNLSRSVAFYYSAGVALGVFATLVFLLLMLKRFIPKLSTFWILMSGCWFSSLYFLYTWKEDLKALWHNSSYYIMGYILIVGLASFAICYTHGPPSSEKSRNLLMWTLQLLGLILVYFGSAIPQVASATIASMLCSKFLRYPLRFLYHVGRKATQFFKSKKLELHSLTEEEYQQQGERETTKALEDLRQFCRRPEFPSWVAVVKLQHPQKFAHFILGCPHVSPEETSAHEEQYGPGGALFEQQLFHTGTEAEPDPQAGSTSREENQQEEEERRKQPNNLHCCTREVL
uniref:Nuclear envelope integral membrane protein 2 n=1 Tax=Anolis carolinensis TaxID=28377 RepID=G1K8U2_ANOCA|nr:PREDICTED: nuclear envelope integral membrane protein 2 isoform X1 [Anolis carolinensis]|eukprot:XP_003217477.2 PREDICTED: nuclear envelope integral membrane protein 2 isoform X1 [Anolis carolinensis]